MNKFKLVDELIINNASLNIDKKNKCFMYKFSEAGIKEKQIIKWLNGKTMKILEFTGKFGGVKKCPWCGMNDFNEDHLEAHGKTKKNIETIKLSKHAYSVLLDETRNGNYDALLFLVHRTCQHCVSPGSSKDRIGKCELPLSARDKPKSLKTLGLKFDGFDINKYSENSIAIVYRNK